MTTATQTIPAEIQVDTGPIRSPVLTDLEACRFLRLDIDRGDDAARAALGRLVSRGKLRPVIVGKCRRFYVPELERFLRDETERYGDGS